MAQKRLIDKKISFSEKLAELPLGAQLLYTWMIPHCDDFGLLQGSPRTIKAQVMPMTDGVSVKDVTEWVETMLEKKLLIKFQYKGKNFYYINDFEENQNLRKDMQPYSVLPVKLSGREYEKNWQKITAIVAECLGRKIAVPSSDEIATEVKRSEVKRSEVINPPLAKPKRSNKDEINEKEYTPDPLVEFCKEKQGLDKPFVNYGKQLNALKKIRMLYKDEEDIKFVIEEMADEEYWRSNPFDMMDVANNMHKYLNRTVMFNQKKGGHKYQ